jgi:glycosyltransferase 2 family protein
MHRSSDAIRNGVARLRGSPQLRIGLGIVLSGLFLYVAVRNVALRDVQAALAQANRAYIMLALGSVAVNILGKAVRWKILMGEAGRRIPFVRILASLLVGQMLNLLLPARAGDLSRAYVIGRQGPGAMFVVGTIVLEKLLDMILYATLFVLLLLLIPLPDWLGSSATAVALVTCVAVIGVAAVTWSRDALTRLLERYAERLPARMRHRLIDRVRSVLASLDVLQNRPDTLKLLVCSILIWGTALLNNHLVLLALNVSLPVSASLLVLVVLQAGITLPSLPGNLGIFEYLCVLALSMFGIEQAAALSYGVVLHGVVMLPPLLAGAILFWWLGPARKEAETGRLIV